MKAGLERIQQVCGAKRGDRTMIDALALDALSSGLSEEASDVRVGASASMRRARAGRASYVSEANHLGHTDPGTEAVAHLFEQLVSANFSLE